MREYIGVVKFLLRDDNCSQLISLLNESTKLETLEQDNRAYLLAISHYFSNNYDEAIACCYEALSLNPLNLEAAFLLVYFLAEIGEYEKSTEILDKINEKHQDIDSNNALVARHHFCISDLYFKNQNYFAAATEIKKALKKNPEEKKYQELKKLIDFRLARKDSSLQKASHIETTFLDSKILREVGFFQYQAGDLQSSKRTFTQTLDLDENDLIAKYFSNLEENYHTGL